VQERIGDVPWRGGRRKMDGREEGGGGRLQGGRREEGYLRRARADVEVAAVGVDGEGKDVEDGRVEFLRGGEHRHGEVLRSVEDGAASRRGGSGEASRRRARRGVEDVEDGGS